MEGILMGPGPDLSSVESRACSSSSQGSTFSSFASGAWCRSEDTDGRLEELMDGFG
jgi:hypothetical protein